MGTIGRAKRISSIFGKNRIMQVKMWANNEIFNQFVKGFSQVTGTICAKFYYDRNAI